MDYMSLGSLKNEKQKSFLKKVCDVFDNHRGNITDDLAITSFKDQSNHKILFNTLNPKLNGKQLILVNNDSGVLFAPVDIQSVLCSDKRNNTDINLIIQKNNRNTWEAISNEKLIKVLVRFEEPKVTIAGFSIQFADSIKTKYQMSLTMVNEENEILGQASGMITSFESNCQQFFQFSQPIEGVNRCVLDIEVVGTNIFEWKVNNISMYNYMNDGSLKALNDSGAIVYTLIPSSVFIKDADIDEQFNEQQPQKIVSEELSNKPSKYVEGAYIDSDLYGTPLVAAPLKSHQFFDNLSQEDMIKISNTKRLYSVTDLHNGHNIYTFETNPNTRNLTLTFSPTQDLNKNSDDPVTELDKLVQKGYIKHGGFKNYSLTLYIKLEEISMTDQNIVWKSSGWLFNDQLPELSRAMDVYIPIGKGKPQVFTEYRYNLFKEIKDNIDIISFNEEPILSDDKWVGFQFIKKVIDKNSVVYIVRMNKNPFTNEGRPNKNISDNSKWVSIMKLEDKSTEDHTACTWGGINDVISITGSKYIHLYGVSLYELEW